MARLTATLLLLGLTALQASAQDYTTSTPFTLQLTSDDPEYDGQFLGACHSGAAIEQLCIAGNDSTPTSYNTFALNTTTGDESGTGVLVWELQGSGFNVSEGLAFQPVVTSNVVFLVFEPGVSTAVNSAVGFDEDDKLFVYSSYYDEANLTPGVYPTFLNQVPLYNVSLFGRRQGGKLKIWPLLLCGSTLTCGFDSFTLAGPTMDRTTTRPSHG